MSRVLIPQVLPMVHSLIIYLQLCVFMLQKRGIILDIEVVQIFMLTRQDSIVNDNNIITLTELEICTTILSPLEQHLMDLLKSTTISLMVD